MQPPKKKKTETENLRAMLWPDDEQLLAEALAKTDEDVAASLIAKGYDLAKLDAELRGLVDRLPSRKRKKRGFIARAALATVALGGAVYAYAAATAPVVVPELLTGLTAASPAPPTIVEAFEPDAGNEGGAR